MEDFLTKDAPVIDQVNDQEPIRKMNFILSKAGLDSVYACFIMANGARMEGIEAEIFFTFFGLDAINKKTLDHLHVSTVGNTGMHMPTLLGAIPGMEAIATGMMKKQMEGMDLPTIPEFLEILDASGVDLFACKLAADMFKLKKEDLYDGVKDIITVGDFYAKAAGKGSHIVFI